MQSHFLVNTRTTFSDGPTAHQASTGDTALGLCGSSAGELEFSLPSRLLLSLSLCPLRLLLFPPLPLTPHFLHPLLRFFPLSPLRFIFRPSSSPSVFFFSRAPQSALPNAPSLFLRVFPFLSFFFFSCPSFTSLLSSLFLHAPPPLYLSLFPLPHLPLLSSSASPFCLLSLISFPTCFTYFSLPSCFSPIPPSPCPSFLFPYASSLLSSFFTSLPFSPLFSCASPSFLFLPPPLLLQNVLVIHSIT